MCVDVDDDDPWMPFPDLIIHTGFEDEGLALSLIGNTR